MNRLVSNIVLGLFAVILIGVYGITKQPAVFSLNQPANDDIQLTGSAPIKVRLPGGAVVTAQVADTPASLEQGLAGVETLSVDRGMLLVFPEAGQHGIWMKGMRIPLDIVWLNEEGKVVHVVEEAPVPTDPQDLPVYTNLDPAKYVLELAAGTAGSTGIEVGDTLGLS